MENRRIEKNIPVNLFTAHNDTLVETDWEFINAKGHGSFKKLVFKNIHICYGEIGLIKNHYVSIEFPVPIVELFFSVLGSTVLYSQSGEKMDFSGNCHNILYCPDGNYYTGTPDCTETAYTFHIVFPETYFSSLTNKVFPVLDPFKKNIKDSLFAWLGSQNMAITPEMNSILREIMDCRRTGMLKCLFMEAKIIKLLMLQLEQFDQLQGKKAVTLKPHDVEKIHYAKLLLDENISAAFSLIELARKTGINDFKLKKGFKEIYGTTVYAYLNDMRMQEARKLLLQNDKTIAEIAAFCGYKFVQNFSAAFKQKYGVSPDKFRK